MGAFEGRCGERGARGGGMCEDGRVPVAWGPQAGGAREGAAEPGVAGALEDARPTRRAFVAGASCAAVGAALSSRAGLGARLARGQDAGAPAEQIVIYHTNDIHGHLQGDESTVGIDLVAGLREATPNCLLVDAGDATQGMPVVTLSKGASAIELMNAAGYDVMCLGNHEFDFGREVLLDNAAAAEFPVLGANVLREDGQTLLEGVGSCGDGATAVLECAGRRIGFFGIVTSGTATSTSPANVAGLEFADEVQTAQACIASLAGQGVDAIVALCHIGNVGAHLHVSDFVAQLGDEAASKLTAVIDGHSHLVENDLYGDVLVVQTGCNLATVGKLTLAFDEDGSVSATEELIDPAAAAELASADGAVAADLAELSQDQEKLMGQALFTTPSTLWAGWLNNGPLSMPTRGVETNMGNVAADSLVAVANAYLEEAGVTGMPVVAATNGGGIRSALARGVVSMGDLVTAFPYSNTVVLKQVTPAILKQMLEVSFTVQAGQDADTGMLLQQELAGRFLQVAGISVVCDPNAELGARVVSLTLDGADEPLDFDDESTPIVLVTNDYIAAGGSDYVMLVDCEQIAEVGGVLEAFQSYLEGIAAPVGGSELSAIPLFAQTEGRINLRGGYEPADWTAVLRTCDAEGQVVPHAPLTVELDAGERRDVESDDDGLVYLEVADGPHAVAVVPDDYDGVSPLPEAYVNNYLGLGLVEDELRAYPTLTVEA